MAHQNEKKNTNSHIQIQIPKVATI